jgi:hypothetical protein
MLLSGTTTQVVQYLEDHYSALERFLDVGPFQRLLPPPLRRRAVIEQFNVPRFLEAVAILRPLLAPDSLVSKLSELLA